MSGRVGKALAGPPGGGGAATCLLLVGDRVVLRSSGPPDVEYVLFDLAEIELRASEPGRVREHGYLTNAADARARLAQHGVTADLARECGIAMHPNIPEAYARGVAVRRIAKVLGPLELFQSDTYDATTQTYHGVFLDLPKLAENLDLPGAGSALQALYLAMLLESEPDDARVLLSTDAHTKTRKPGERTFKRPNLASAATLATALAELGQLDPKPEIADALPRADVSAFLRARADAATDDDTRALYLSLDRTVSSRAMPERGPLADAELWAIENKLDEGRTDGTLEAIDAFEQTRGRSPGTTYLRARASLLSKIEPPKLIAERISALALSMTSFQELSLLAAEAWLEAEDPRRALPYARDLVDAPSIDEGLLTRARTIFARAASAAPEKAEPSQTLVDSIPAGPMAPSRPPPPQYSSPPSPISVPPPVVRRPSMAERGDAPVLERNEPPMPERRTNTNRGIGAVTGPGSLPPPSPPRRPSASRAPSQARALSAPPPVPPPPPSSSSPSMQPKPARGRSSHPPPRRGPVAVETRPPPSLDPRAEPDSTPPAPAILAPRGSYRPEAPTPILDANDGRLSSVPPLPPPLPAARRGAAERMIGASRPPYAVETPAPVLPKAPLMPKLGGAPDELAELFELPPGVREDAPITTAMPRSVFEARVKFSLLSRELGAEYRTKRGIALQTDLAGIEAMQAVLLETFPDHVVRTEDEAREVERHGAFLSELLARRLDAVWLDISSAELGHWAMLVPPDTRVWPFGRLLRFIAHGHRERDLVSYFLELSARTR